MAPAEEQLPRLNGRDDERHERRQPDRAHELPVGGWIEEDAHDSGQPQPGDHRAESGVAHEPPAALDRDRPATGRTSVGPGRPEQPLAVGVGGTDAGGRLTTAAPSRCARLREPHRWRWRLHLGPPPVHPPRSGQPEGREGGGGHPEQRRCGQRRAREPVPGDQREPRERGADARPGGSRRHTQHRSPARRSEHRPRAARRWGSPHRPVVPGDPPGDGHHRRRTTSRTAPDRCSLRGTRHVRSVPATTPGLRRAAPRRT